MTLKEGKVVVDADRANELLDEIRREFIERIDNLGRFLAAGMTTKSPAPARQRRTEKASTSAMPVSVNVSGINWLTKDKEVASPNAAWSWAYGYDIKGEIRPETQALIQEILKYGKVTTGGFEFSLSGRDMNLLSRKKLTHGSR